MQEGNQILGTRDYGESITPRERVELSAVGIVAVSVFFLAVGYLILAVAWLFPGPPQWLAVLLISGASAGAVLYFFPSARRATTTLMVVFALSLPVGYVVGQDRVRVG